LLAGGAYATTGLTPMNGSPLHGHLLGLLPPMPPEIGGTADADAVARTMGALEDALASVLSARPASAAGEIARREIAQAIRLARHGAWHVARTAGYPAPDAGAQLRDLADDIDEQAACWRLRSRPGGLADSLARLHAARERLGR